MTGFKTGDIAVRTFGDHVGDIVYVVSVSPIIDGREWVDWSYGKPDQGETHFNGSVSDRLRPASTPEILFWRLGLYSPKPEHFEALDEYIEWWALR